MMTRYNLPCAARLATEKRLSERPPHSITDDNPGQVMQEIISRQDALARGLKTYFTGKPCINGHIDFRNAKKKHCIACQAETWAAWARKNREKRAEYKRIRHAANPEIKAATRARAAEKAGKTYTPMPHRRGINTHKQKVPRAYESINGATWYFRDSKRLDSAHDGQAMINALEAWRHHIKFKASDAWVSRYFELRGDPWANPRLSEAEYYRLRYALDPEFNLRERLRRQITKKRKRDGVSDVMRRAIRVGGESGVIEKLFGYSISQLKVHLENHFHDGMDWPAFMRGEIHIDHIRPQAAFDLLDDDQYRQCWALSNLRPLWAADNLAKSDFMPCGRRARDARLAA